MMRHSHIAVCTAGAPNVHMSPERRKQFLSEQMYAAFVGTVETESRRVKPDHIERLMGYEKRVRLEARSDWPVDLESGAVPYSDFCDKVRDITRKILRELGYGREYVVWSSFIFLKALAESGAVKGFDISGHFIVVPTDMGFINLVGPNIATTVRVLTGKQVRDQGLSREQLQGALEDLRSYGALTKGADGAWLLKRIERAVEVVPGNDAIVEIPLVVDEPVLWHGDTFVEYLSGRFACMRGEASTLRGYKEAARRRDDIAKKKQGLEDEIKKLQKRIAEREEAFSAEAANANGFLESLLLPDFA